jgi:hypothetical protein
MSLPNFGIAKSYLSERFQPLSLAKMIAGFEISAAIGNIALQASM